MNEALGFFKEFHEQSRFVKNLHATFFGFDSQETDCGGFQGFKTN